MLTVKQELLKTWPGENEGAGGKCPQLIEGEENRIRFVCMGKGLLNPETKKLVDFNLPVFTGNATPVNVSIKPGPVDKKGNPIPAKKKAAARVTNRESSGGAPNTAAGVGGAGGGGGGNSDDAIVANRCTCIIV